ncbi:MAG: M20 family metallopeptidase [Cyclobacteriaceae bacterium]
MDLKTRIKELSESYYEEVLSIRRHIHANPELSFQEYETSKYVRETLESFGYDGVKSVANTGLTVTVEGKNPGKKVIALRADMDALPIHEQNDVDYKSKNDGIMHACGHDVHTASMLGAAKILHEVKDHFEGTVKFIFQPGEEKLPGGASIMIKDGILENPDPAEIIGQHVMPLVPVGKVGFRKGMYMASADEIYVTVKGKGGHGAMPETCVDPVLISSHIIVALQQIVSRVSSPKMPSVLTFGKVIAEGATNIIPNEVKIEGTFRTFDEEWRKEAHRKMKKMAEGMAEAMGGSCDFDIHVGYPYLENHPELTEFSKNAAIDYLGAENVVDLDLWLAAEDFAYYTHERDACFYRLGIKNEEKGITSSVHTPTFNIDENALKIGMGLMSWLAISNLSK